MTEGFTEEEYKKMVSIGRLPSEFEKFRSYEGEELYYHKEYHKHHFEYRNKRR